MVDISDQKASARKAGFAARKAVKSDERNQRACEHLLAFLDSHKGKPAAGYMSIQTEINPISVMLELARHGPVGVPVILGAGQPLEFRRWDAKTPMETGPFGAMVPINAQIVVPSVLIVPLVAFDGEGRRLGYGGGFYDRTLQNLRNAGETLAVGFAFAGQQLEEIPSEDTDQMLDAIVTENGVLTFR